MIIFLRFSKKILCPHNLLSVVGTLKKQPVKIATIPPNTRPTRRTPDQPKRQNQAELTRKWQCAVDSLTKKGSKNGQKRKERKECESSLKETEGRLGRHCDSWKGTFQTDDIACQLLTIRKHRSGLSSKLPHRKHRSLYYSAEKHFTLLSVAKIRSLSPRWNVCCNKITRRIASVCVCKLHNDSSQSA